MEITMNEFNKMSAYIRSLTDSTFLQVQTKNELITLNGRNTMHGGTIEIDEYGGHHTPRMIKFSNIKYGIIVSQYDIDDEFTDTMYYRLPNYMLLKILRDEYTLLNMMPEWIRNREGYSSVYFYKLDEVE
jgi:hypothetical protein